MPLDACAQSNKVAVPPLWRVAIKSDESIRQHLTRHKSSTDGVVKCLIEVCNLTFSGAELKIDNEQDNLKPQKSLGLIANTIGQVSSYQSTFGNSIDAQFIVFQSFLNCVFGRFSRS